LKNKIISSIVIFVLLLALFPFVTHAQIKKLQNLPRYDNAIYHFGFTVAINRMNFTIKPASYNYSRIYDPSYSPELNVDSSMVLSITSKPTFGFSVGIVGDMKLGRYFNLRLVPSLSFGERSLDYTVLGWDDGEEKVIDISKSVASGMVDVPLIVKYKSKRLNNMRMYVLAGLQYSLDLASNAKRKEVNNVEQIKLEKHDLYFVTGVGADFYNAWFKFGIELKMNYGINDMLKREETIYTQSIDKLTSKIFVLAMTFE
jgi:hypothetical protein